jgi:aminomethyltransferase
MGEIFVKGPDAARFVDYLITNDFFNSPVNKAVYSPLCRDNGTIIDDLISYKVTNDFVMICVNAANKDKDFSWIYDQHKKNQFDCELVDKSENYSLLAVQGPKAFETLKKISALEALNDIEYYSVQILKDGDTPLIAARTGYTGEDGFEIFADHETTLAIWDELISHGAIPCGLGARDVLRLEVCYPLYGQELSDEVTPLDSALKWTVKAAKDSFIGKDALADYQPKYQLIKLILDKGIPRSHYQVIQNDKVIGEVTSGTMSVMLKKGIALARVDKSVFNKEENIFVNIRDKHYPAQYTTKAFVTGGHK